jgi:hypothetical protein
MGSAKSVASQTAHQARPPKPGGGYRPPRPTLPAAKPKHLPASLRGKALPRGYGGSRKGAYSRRCGCVVWLGPGRLWYYWCPRFLCYLPVRYVYVYPPQESAEEPPDDPDSCPQDG